MPCVLRAERSGHCGAPVATLCAIARVAQTVHQRSPGRRDMIDAPTDSHWLGRKAKARQRRANHVKGVSAVAAMGGRIGQRLDHLVELNHRARPAVGDDQRHGLRVWGAHVQEMNVEPVDLSSELRKAVEQRFATAPIIVLSPVLADLFDPLQRRALAPVVDQLCLRPASPLQSRLKIREHVITDRNPKGLDDHGNFFRRQRTKRNLENLCPAHQSMSGYYRARANVGLGSILLKKSEY